jgi:hypothetical protein
MAIDNTTDTSEVKKRGRKPKAVKEPTSTPASASTSTPAVTPASVSASTSTPVVSEPKPTPAVVVSTPSEPKSLEVKEPPEEETEPMESAEPAETTETTEPIEPTEPQRKRGRKKKYVIESIKKLRDVDSVEDKIEFDSVNENLDKLENKTQVSFGSLNITVHRDNPINKQELRKLFDNEFNLEEVEKVPSVLMQEEQEECSESATKNYKILENCWSEGSVGSAEGHWPEKTDIWCHWCCHPFDTAPVPCPVKYDYITNKFDVKGVFCSWACSAAYSIDKYKSLNNLYILRKSIEGTETPINVAGPKVCLKVFGGYMSIEEFRAKSGEKEIKKVYITNDVSFKPVNQYIFEE